MLGTGYKKGFKGLDRDLVENVEGYVHRVDYILNNKGVQQQKESET